MEFGNEFEEACARRGIDLNQMRFVDFITEIADWIYLNRVTRRPLFSA
jgi:hypothetical protein